ncbi:type VI secretion system-associated FHA domain protein TagH [soil metagenome]
MFGSAGGIIGRVGGMPGDRRDAWILPHTKVSKEHARISLVNGAFYVEDTSRNGVALNSSKNRLAKGRPYALKSGDRLFIDPYEISVSVASESYEPYEDVHRPVEIPSFSRDELALEEELDPLNLLDPQPASPPRRKVPTAEDLNAAAPWAGHYEPPAVLQPPAPKPPARASSAPVMPEGYNPLAPEEAEPDPGPEEFESFFPPYVESESVTSPPPAERQTDPFAPVPAPRAEIARPAVGNPLPAPPSAPVADPAEHRDGSDLAAVLAGAGLEGVAVTPELARSFGEILHVVVAGVMDVLQARHQIKDEFRMRMTHLRVADNNPLKFSAGVDDALHNLLVKRNQAYLSPVQAFEDAFEDLRHHQIAMLAGMRVAFEFMLAEFAPDRLEEQFARQIEKGALIGKTAGLRHLRSWRYWELYRDKQLEIAKDPETSFRKLFGEAFAKAYEEQLERLRAQR